MPLLWLAVGGGVGFFAAKGVEGISNTVKWTALAGAAYIVAKKTKAL